MNSVSCDFSEQAAPTGAAGRLLGESAAMQDVYRLIERVGPTEASVLLTGESGSGKELAAQSIHACSRRRSGPFVAINCGAIPAGLIEAELFGYEKGGFTGAARAHAGVFERAQGILEAHCGDIGSEVGHVPAMARDILAVKRMPAAYAPLRLA